MANNTPNPSQPIPPLPPGPLNAPIHGPRLPGHPGTAEPRLPGPGPQQQFADPGGAQQFAAPGGQQFTGQPGQPFPGQYPGMAPRPFEPTLPVVPTHYASFWRTPAYRVWRPIVALVLGFLGFFLLGMIALVASALIGQLLGGPDWFEAVEGAGGGNMTPWVFLGNNVGLALMIPLVIGLAVLLFKQPPGWIMSLAGKMRWGWLVRCLVILTPIWLIYMGIDVWLSIRTGKMPELSANPDTVLLIIGILITQPLQSAGEEFAFRGLANRGAAAFFANQKVGLLVGAVFSSVLFMFAHGAGDLWLNIYYFFFGAIACFLTWWTGGLEAAIAMHVVNNLLAMWTVPFSDISGLFDRQAGVAGPTVLIGVVVISIAAAILAWQGKKLGLVREAAPARSMLPAEAPAGGPTPPGVASMPAPAGPAMPQVGPPMPPAGPAMPPAAAPTPPASYPQQAQPTDAPLSNPRPWQG